mmetsp:Transcript_51845/g.102866  ORF Transcript_51845/g.102866 Transcript_51845/m.102866 type:complete len:236 (+) Transcript_51845:1010-1717(+)
MASTVGAARAPLNSVLDEMVALALEVSIAVEVSTAEDASACAVLTSSVKRVSNGAIKHCNRGSKSEGSGELRQAESNTDMSFSRRSRESRPGNTEASEKLAPWPTRKNCPKVSARTATGSKLSTALAGTSEESPFWFLGLVTILSSSQALSISTSSCGFKVPNVSTALSSSSHTLTANCGVLVSCIVGLLAANAVAVKVPTPPPGEWSTVPPYARSSNRHDANTPLGWMERSGSK